MSTLITGKSRESAPPTPSPILELFGDLCTCKSDFSASLKRTVCQRSILFFRKSLKKYSTCSFGKGVSPEGPNKRQSWSAAHPSFLISFVKKKKLYRYWKEIVLDGGRTDEVLSKFANKWRNIEARVMWNFPDSRSFSEVRIYKNL